ncbi:MAG: hypothetical protein ACK5PZ_08025, partial [Pirellula sp.]
MPEYEAEDLLVEVGDLIGFRFFYLSNAILWESKRTKRGINAWLTKARDDQRAARTDCVVI